MAGLLGPLEGASCLELSQETTWSSYNDDSRPLLAPPLSVTRSSPRQHSTCRSPHPKSGRPKTRRTFYVFACNAWRVGFTQTERLALTSHLWRKTSIKNNVVFLTLSFYPYFSIMENPNFVLLSVTFNFWHWWKDIEGTLQTLNDSKQRTAVVLFFLFQPF